MNPFGITDQLPAGVPAAGLLCVAVLGSLGVVLLSAARRAVRRAPRRRGGRYCLHRE